MFRTTKVSDFNCDSGIGGYCPVAAISSLRVSYLTLSCPHRTASCFIIAVTPTGLDEPTRKPRVSLVIMQLSSATKKDRQDNHLTLTHPWKSQEMRRTPCFSPQISIFHLDCSGSRVPMVFPRFPLGLPWGLRSTTVAGTARGRTSVAIVGKTAVASDRHLTRPNFRGGWGISWCNKIVCRHLYYTNSVHINISDILI